ncbi:MAG TPA: hypothetical protein VLC53_19720, partial [Myxococcota bacterium]|nr:hypothetical protein [Myxococcota bacterium]
MRRSRPSGRHRSLGQAAIRKALVLLGALLATGAAAPEHVPVPIGVRVEGVGPVPAALARALAPYDDFREHRLLSWHPFEREMLVARRAGDAVETLRVAAPGATPRPLAGLGSAARAAH